MRLDTYLKAFVDAFAKSASLDELYTLLGYVHDAIDNHPHSQQDDKPGYGHGV